MDLQLQGKRALITGGSKGIGRATASALAEEGCRVLIAARDAAALEAASKDIRAKASSEVLSRPTDLSQRGAAEALAEWAGDLDILVNNAGAIPGGDLLNVDEDTWRRAWDLKVFGYINLSRAVYAKMKARRQGVIVNVLGYYGERVNPAFMATTTANASLMAFTRALGGASHADGIRVVGVSPGPVATDLLFRGFRKMAAAKLGDASRYEELFRDLPFGRPARPEEIGWAVAFLASARSAYTTGSVLTVDGGLVSRF